MEKLQSELQCKNLIARAKINSLGLLRIGEQYFIIAAENKPGIAICAVRGMGNMLCVVKFCPLKNEAFHLTSGSAQLPAWTGDDLTASGFQPNRNDPL
jgi:hypothetical protein